MLKEQHWKYVLEVQPGGEEVEVKKRDKNEADHLQSEEAQ